MNFIFESDVTITAFYFTDQLPPATFEPTSHPSNTNAQDGVLVAVPDPSTLPVNDTLVDAVIGPHVHGRQQLIGIQTVDHLGFRPVRKLKRGGRRQQGNKFNRNGRQGNKRTKVNRRNMGNKRKVKNNKIVVIKRGRGIKVSRGNRRKQNQRNKNGARGRGPIMRVPNMQDVGVSSLPKDHPSGKQGAQDTLDPMTGLKVGQLNEHLLDGTILNHETQHTLDPLDSSGQVPSDVLIPVPGIPDKQQTNVIQHDAAFHRETSTKLDANPPNIEHSSSQKLGTSQKVAAPLDDIALNTNNVSTLFDPDLTVTGGKTGRKNNKPIVNKKGRNKWKKVKKQNRLNRKKDPIIREPKKYKPVEILSVVKQEEKPTTPETSNMIRIAGLGFLDLGPPTG